MKIKAKPYGHIWYLPKHDTIVEIDLHTSKWLMILLLKWDQDFDRDGFMFMGET